jgi:GT2 family glycosyltransferase
MSLAIVLLSYNGRDDTLACLQSLELVTDVDQIVVVDNASADHTAAAVRERYPQVEVLEQDANLGFAEGNNVGIRHAIAAGADWVLIANNDTTFAPDSVTQLLAVARAHPDAGIVCPLIRYAQPPDRIWYAGRSFDPRRGYHGRAWGLDDIDNGQFAGVHEVDTATGCAMLMPAAALAQIGLMDPDLFLYLEDTDWSLRFRAAGYRVLVAGDALLWHRVSAAGGGKGNVNSHYYETRNTLVVCSRHAPLSRPRAALREAECVFTHLVHVRSSPQPLRAARAVLQAWSDYHGARMGPRR